MKAQHSSATGVWGTARELVDLARATLGRIDFGPKDEVTEGAAVNIGGRWFVIGVATDAFECDGRTFMGISAEAPIYQAIAGAGAGDGHAHALRALADEHADD